MDQWREARNRFRMGETSRFEDGPSEGVREKEEPGMAQSLGHEHLGEW